MTIGKAEFNPKEMRLTFLAALGDVLPSAKSNKVDAQAAATGTWNDFTKHIGKLLATNRRRGYEPIDSSTCCGVSEMSFEGYYDYDAEDIDEEAGEDVLTEEHVYQNVVIKLASAFNSYKVNPYFKYYNNGQAEADNCGQKPEHIFKALEKLGWVCTAKFINTNHNWFNYEMTAYYGATGNE